MRKRLCLLICGAAGMAGVAGVAAVAVIPPAGPVTCPDCSPLVYLQGIEVPVCSSLGSIAFAPAPPMIPANPAQHPAQARLPAFGAMLAGMQLAFNPPAHAGLSVGAPAAAPNGVYAALGGATASAQGVGADYAALVFSARQAARAEYAALPASAPGEAARADYAALQASAPGQATRADYAALTATAPGEAARADYAALPATAPGEAARADYAALTASAPGQAARADYAALTVSAPGQAARADYAALPATAPGQATRADYAALTASAPGQAARADYAELTASAPEQATRADCAALTASAPGQATRADYAALTVSAPGQATRADYAALSLHAMTLGAPPTYGVAQPHTPAFAIERRGGLASGASLGRSGPDWFALSGQTPVTAGADATRKPVTYSTGLPAVDPFIGCESAEPWAYSVAGMYANRARAAKARGDQEAYVKLVNQYLQMMEQSELRKTMPSKRR